MDPRQEQRSILYDKMFPLIPSLSFFLIAGCVARYTTSIWSQPILVRAALEFALGRFLDITIFISKISTAHFAFRSIIDGCHFSADVSQDSAPSACRGLAKKCIIKCEVYFAKSNENLRGAEAFRRKIILKNAMTSVTPGCRIGRAGVRGRNSNEPNAMATRTGEASYPQ